MKVGGNAHHLQNNNSNVITLFVTFAILPAITATLTVNETHRSLYEQLLFKKLLSNYNKNLNPPGTIQVKFSLNLKKIVNLIEKDQIILIDAWIDHEWIDTRLSWNPLEYGNLTLMRISGDYVWTPDTYVYSTADRNGFLLPQSGAYFIIKHEGFIFWPNPLQQLKLKCPMNTRWFPFDEQLCQFVFGSWSYTRTYLNYTFFNENPSLDTYEENNEWTLKEVRTSRIERFYADWIEMDSFTEITYKLIIIRKHLFVLQNSVVPAVMLTLLTLVSFFIPFAQAMQIGISIMLSFSVFKLRLSDDVPVQSDYIPLINIYFTLCMSISLFAMIWFSIIQILKDRPRVPYLVRIFVTFFLSWAINKEALDEYTNEMGNGGPSDDCNDLDNTDRCSVNSHTIANSSRLKRKSTSSSLKNASCVNKRRAPANDAARNEVKILIETYPSPSLMTTTHTVTSRPSLPLPTHSGEHPTNGQAKSVEIPISKTTLSSVNSETQQHHQQRQSIQSVAINNNNTSASASNQQQSCARRIKSSSMHSSSWSASPSQVSSSSCVRKYELAIISALNKFVFCIFLAFVFGLNFLGLFIFPLYLKMPLSIEDD